MADPEETGEAGTSGGRNKVKRTKMKRREERVDIPLHTARRKTLPGQTQKWSHPPHQVKKAEHERKISVSPTNITDTVCYYSPI